MKSLLKTTSLSIEDVTHAPTDTRSSKKQINPSVILLIIVLLAVSMTYVIDSGQFKRNGALVVSGSYTQLEKDRSASHLFNMQTRSPNEVRPVSIAEGFLAIPQGLAKQTGLIFMVLFIGGMFGVLNKAGVIDAGLTRMLGLSRGNVYILIPLLMLIFSLGSTFVGMSKEYVLMVPLMVAMANRLGLPSIIGLAIVVISVKIGYLSSISNPVALAVAQPIVGVPIFSGMGMRVMTYIIFLIVGVAFVLLCISRTGFDSKAQISFDRIALPARLLTTLLALMLGIAFLVYATHTWDWKFPELSAYYIGLSVVFAVIMGMNASVATEAFVEGMKKVLMAAVLIGLATAVEIILSTGLILDSIVNALANMTQGHGPVVSAYGMLFSQLGLDVLIPSTSGQAAITMPIFGPLGQLTGVTPQTTVYAFLLGHGLSNMITPTSSGLLVLLATAQVGWTHWARFILPLFLVYFVIALLLLSFAVATGY